MASKSNQASSSSSSSRAYDVFLSFRGEDTRDTFTDHLYTALCHKGIITYLDEKLDRGEEIGPALREAIEESRISVIVFSENYASSRWCLDELVHILHCQDTKKQKVRPIFYKVNPSDLRNQRSSFGDALASHECKYIEKVDIWKEALSQAANLSGWPFVKGRESQFIQKIVNDISLELSKQTLLDVAVHPVGIGSRVQDMLKLLDTGRDDVRMVGIWGIGGIGKTTIAKAVFRSIRHQFDRACFLADVRKTSEQHGGLVQLQKTLLHVILGDNLEFNSVDKGVQFIKDRLRHRRILLVLDDVLYSDQLEKLAGESGWFGSGSRIIITTRDKHLLNDKIHSVYDLKKLDDSEALELFSLHAFKRNGPPDDFVKHAKQIVNYAQGLPLALTVLGSHLCGRSIDQWVDALDRSKKILPEGIQDVLRISFDALEDSAKEIFLDLACFFNGQKVGIVKEILGSCDLNPVIGIEELIEKSLVTVDTIHSLPDDNIISMHDLLEDLGKEIVRQESKIEPGERSRLWHHKDVYGVLTENTGTHKIKGIVVKFPYPEELFLGRKSFSKMKNLRFFISGNVCFSGDIIRSWTRD